MIPVIISLMFFEVEGRMVLKAVYDPDTIRNTEQLAKFLRIAAANQFPEPTNATSSNDSFIGNKLAN
jgi:hypothetical protein